MNNKTFPSLNKAFRYFDLIKSNWVAFLIHNREDDTYEVINQDTYDYYLEMYLLDMEIIELSC